MEALEYSVLEAATALGISKSVLYELMDDGLIPYHHIGRKRLISWLALEDFTQFMYENGSVVPVEVGYD